MTLRRVQILVPVGGGGGGEVDRDRIIHEGLEPFPVPIDLALLRAQIIRDEVFPDPVESTIVAAALIADETPTPPVESFVFTVGLSEVAPQPSDAAILGAVISENLVPPLDSAGIMVNIPDLVPVPVESTPLFVRTSPLELFPEPIEGITAIVAVSGDNFPTPLDNSGRISVIGVRPANVVVSQTAVTNPNNVLDTDVDEATVVATATGVGGVTVANVPYSLVVSFADFVLSWLTDITSAQIVVPYRIFQGGTNLGPTQSVLMEYSLNDGVGWTTFLNSTTQQVAVLNATANILSAVGDDWTKLNQLRVRISGTIGSGTGLGANNTLGIQNIRLTFNAEQILT